MGASADRNARGRKARATTSRMEKLVAGHPAELWRKLESGDERARWEASMELIRSSSQEAALRTARILRDGASPRVREVAAWILCSLGRGAPAVVNALLEALDDAFEHMSVRAQAAEALGCHSSPSKRARLRSTRALMDILEHPAAELRFWAAYSLGALGHRPALPALRKLAREDERVCPGWWYVSEEAEDAIAHIERRRTPDRIPVMRR